MDIELPILSEIELLKSQKRFATARKKLEDAIAKYPDRAELYEELADVYIFEGEIEKAENALEYCEQIGEQSPTTLYLRGYISLLKNSFLEAIVYLEESNNENPNNPEVLRNLGWAYTMVGEQRKGLAILERALTIAPEDELIIEDIGVALLAQGKIREARGYLRKVGKEKHIKNFGSLV